MSNIPFGFRMNLETLELFYTRCLEREAITREERIKVLEELVNELRALRITEEDLKNQIKGKKVLVIKKGTKSNEKE